MMVSEAIHYRSPHDNEAVALAALGRKSFCDSFGYIYAAEDLAAFLEAVFSVDAVRAEMANPKRRYLVADQNGSLVGYCKIGEGVTLDYQPGEKTVLELMQLYILADHHGGGVAQHMMQWVLDQAADYAADEIVLSVYSENPRAQAFYKKYGFAHVADTVFMVGNHADHEFIYSKLLNK